MSVNEKMTAIADAIREKGGVEGPLSLDGMAAGINEVYHSGFNDGQLDGLQWCELHHFANAPLGTDTNSISFFLDFKPDFIAISCFEPHSRLEPSTYCNAICDLRSVARSPVAFIVYVKSDGTPTNTNVSYASAHNIFTYSDGVFTFVPPSSTEFQAAKWRRELRYFVVAFKYFEMSDKALITEQISRLPSEGGTISFAAAAISAAFTDEEWAALIATKPNWTFTLA